MADRGRARRTLFGLNTKKKHQRDRGFSSNHSHLMHAAGNELCHVARATVSDMKSGVAPGYFAASHRLATLALGPLRRVHRNSLHVTPRSFCPNTASRSPAFRNNAPTAGVSIGQAGRVSVRLFARLDDDRPLYVPSPVGCTLLALAIDAAAPARRRPIAVNPTRCRIADRLAPSASRMGPCSIARHPVIKDNIDTGDRMLTTAGSLALEGAPAPRDAFVVERLRMAGVVILGKTNLSEWANIRSGKSTSGWSARGGLVKNPYVLDRNPCGSSSGTGAAIAASLAAVGVGTETDGSSVCLRSAHSWDQPTLTVSFGIIPSASRTRPGRWRGRCDSGGAFDRPGKCRLARSPTAAGRRLIGLRAASTRTRCRAAHRLPVAYFGYLRRPTADRRAIKR